MNWIKCAERMPPPGTPVLAFVPDFGGGGLSRRIRAHYAAPLTLPLSEDADPAGGDYDEKTDEYYAEEGWYETNEYEETHWRVGGQVTHWMPLPRPPEME